jgi:hypothetical protein
MKKASGSFFCSCTFVLLCSPIASSADDDAVDLKMQGVTVSLDDEEDGFGMSRAQGCDMSFVGVYFHSFRLELFSLMK